MSREQNNWPTRIGIWETCKPASSEDYVAGRPYIHKHISPSSSEKRLGWLRLLRLLRTYTAILSLWSELSPFNLLPSFLHFIAVSNTPRERERIRERVRVCVREREKKKCDTWKLGGGGNDERHGVRVCAHVRQAGELGGKRKRRDFRGECLLSFYDQSLTLSLSPSHTHAHTRTMVWKHAL